MGRITDARGEESFDILDALIEELDSIVTDSEISAMMTGKKAAATSVMALGGAIIRRHRDAVIKILALDDGVEPEKELGLLSPIMVPVKLKRILENPLVRELLFGSAATKDKGAGSSAASGSGEGE